MRPPHKFMLLFTILIILPFVLPTTRVASSSSTPSESQLQQAASYLISLYNPILRLVANSEDQGPNPLGDLGVPCHDTYWIYDDNLWAGWALSPFNTSIAENIKHTVDEYTDLYGRSMLFEAAIGEPVPTTIHAHKLIKVYDNMVNDTRVQILLDRHQFTDNPGIFEDAEKYADLCFYMTINYWMLGDVNASLHWFRSGEALWNHTTQKGFYDKAVYDAQSATHHRYHNFKLGLFLLAQRVTRFESDIVEEVEGTVWSYQNALGGITTQSWLNGTLYGTANAEATSAVLLAYNEDLLERLYQRQSVAERDLNDAKQNITHLEHEVTTLQHTPWLADPWPLWFTSLLASTLALGAISVILIFRRT